MRFLAENASWIWVGWLLMIWEGGLGLGLGWVMTGDVIGE